MYLKCQAQEATTTAHTLEACITDVNAWMNMNSLKLNADKTELLWAGSKHGSALHGSSGPNIKLDAARIAVAVGHDSWPFPSQPTTGTPSSSSSFPFIREVDTQNYVTVIKHQIKW